MSIVQTSNINFPNDPETLKTIKDALFELSASMTRIEGEKDFQKEALSDLAEKTQVPKKYLSRMANLYHRQNKAEVEGDNELLSELYDAVFGESTDQDAE